MCGTFNAGESILVQILYRNISLNFIYVNFWFSLASVYNTDCSIRKKVS